MIHIAADSPQDAAEITARLIRDMVVGDPRAVLGLATGQTMRPVYKALTDMTRENGPSFQNVVTFNLDEYLGLPPGDPALFKTYMQRALLDHIDIKAENFHIPDGQSPDANTEAARYEQALASAGGIDLQLLGVGTNGHIGFNEPGSSPRSRTRIVTLSEQTRRDNFPDHFRGRGKDNTAPRRAISMGIATILSARKIVLLATGARKAAAVARLLAGTVDPDWPCTYLTGHNDATLITDPPARGHTD